MNTENEFDALARQKLEARDFLFEEENWAEMQAVLDAQKKRKKRAGLWFGGAGLFLLLISSAWYLSGTGATKTAPPTRLSEIRTEQRITPRSTQPTTLETLNRTELQDTTTVTEHSTNANKSSVSSETNRINTKDQSALNTYHEIVKQQKKDLDQALGSTSHNRKQEQAERANLTKSENEFDPISGHNTVSTSYDKSGKPINTSLIETGTNSGVQVEPQLTDGPTSDTENASADQGPSKQNEATREDDPDSTQKNDGTRKTPERSSYISNGAQRTDSASAETDANTSETVPNKDLISSDLTPLLDIVPDLNVENDSTALPRDTTAATLEPLLPLIRSVSPWEISFLGGAMRTNTRYSGGSSNTWNSNDKQPWSIHVGAEVMHMGRNFGIGGGIHFGAYKERIRTDAIDRTTYDVNNFWYLLPVDTTILSIGGITIQGSDTFYTGVSIDTTINVITRGSDSTAITQRIRDARDITNSVNYIEVPLLVDGHLVQGRWNLGIRCGPTVGLLTGAGYTALTDQPFKEVVFGWTARAYIRYRFNAAWSIGFEPMIRSQFNNGSGDIIRRSTTYGGQFSISYRLRQPLELH